jgi:hypothetical protein
MDTATREQSHLCELIIEQVNKNEPMVCLQAFPKEAIDITFVGYDEAQAS